MKQKTYVMLVYIGFTIYFACISISQANRLSGGNKQRFSQNTNRSEACANQLSQAGINYLNTPVDSSLIDPSVGCAWQLNQVVNNAYGAPIDYSPPPITFGTSTATMFTDLCNNSNWQQVSLSDGANYNGSIIISPTSGSSTGHVGIITNGVIYSNSSSTGTFRQNFSINSWINTYSNLGIYVFVPVTNTNGSCP
jgi:hypothetical protein